MAPASMLRPRSGLRASPALQTRLQSLVLVLILHSAIGTGLFFCTAQIPTVPPSPSAFRVVTVSAFILPRSVRVSRQDDGYGWLRQASGVATVPADGSSLPLSVAVFGCRPEQLSHLSAEDRAACIRRLGWVKPAAAAAGENLPARHADLWQEQKRERDRPVQLPCTGSGGGGVPRTIATSATPSAPVGTGAMVSVNPVCLLNKFRDALQ